jgi:acetyl-CoA acetyltransferase
LGDPPVTDIQDVLRLELDWHGTGMSFGGPLSPLMQAILAVSARLARHVVVYRTVESSRMRAGSAVWRDQQDAEAGAGRVSGAMQWSVPYGVYGAMPAHAMALRRHMHLYGTTKEQLGWIAVTQRLHAGMNERAVYREPITLDDYLASRPICEPLSLLDCDVPVDGSVAVVVSGADHSTDLPHPAVRIHAVGGAVHDRGFTWDQRTDFPQMMMTEAARQLWSRADLSPTDVSVAELYDGFSFAVVSWLEALGFCAQGEGGPFVEGGSRIRLGGPLPLNTYGGQMSGGRMHGYWLLHEACLQLRHQAGDRQVKDAEVAVAAAGSGPFAGCLLLTADR